MTKKVTDYAVLHIAVIAKRTNVTITDYFSQHTAQHLIMIKYGLPYKGSKNKLAERIVNLLPRASHFYDLFSGGCAVAHCALTKGRYEHVHINDINEMMPKAFVKALQGGFDDEDRWISHEEFFRLKDTDPYVALCFSFGNNLKNYCYGKDIEPIKKAMHYAIFFDSYELSDSLIGVDLRPIRKCATRQEKYIMAKRLISNTPPNIVGKLPKTGANTDCKLTKDRSASRILPFKKKRQELQSLERLSRISTITTRLKSFERLLQVKNKAGKTSCLTWSTKDYQDVTIEDNSVIYCDIPYKNTGGYVGKGSNFDYERFYEWCLKQTQPLFISSYEMPENDFKVIAEFARTDTQCATNNSKKVIERIFIPRTQDIKLNSQLNLF